jgi:flagellar protein FliS
MSALMPSKHGIAAYRTGLKTASPLTSVVMLYDGILVRVARAAAAARTGDVHDQLDQVMRAVQILNGLNQSLDMEAGGRVAVSLRDMYGAVAVALFNSVGRPSGAEACDKVAAAVRRTRNAWASIAGMPPLSDPAPSGAAISEAGMGSNSSPSTGHDRSSIVPKGQELLPHRTSKKSDHADRAAIPEPGRVPGLPRSVRRKSGSLA